MLIIFFNESVKFKRFNLSAFESVIKFKMHAAKA